MYYYRIYRRRQYIYFAAFIFGLILLINLKKNGPPKDTHNIKRNSNEVININNYVEPEPCIGCPGENGKAVYLSVRLIYYFVLIILKIFII